MSSFRSDGKAVDVTLDAAVEKNDPVLQEGWAGIALADGDSGDTIAIEVEREHEIVVGSSVTAAKGDILYISDAGVITNTNTDRPFMKVTIAKDANDVVAGKLLPQME